MRNWGRNIVIDGSWLEQAGAYQGNQDTFGLRPYKAEIYERHVQDLMRQLEQSSKVGGAMIKAINQSPRQLRIVPHLVGSVAATSAHIVTTGKENQCLKVACAAGGSDVVIRFEPQTYTNTFFREQWDRSGIVRPDDVLLHELIHALRIMRGILDWTPMGNKYDRVEEFCVILLTNIYVSEVGRTNDLRGDHRAPFVTLKQANHSHWGDADVIHYMNFQKEIDGLVKAMPDICAAITSLNIEWNPIRRQYWHYKLQGNW
ncbi:MAG: hypothetical protein JNL98_23955 [Bryobacterales bacterium]|nr:hypothetical protein [Bryobacterales bacterium]